MPRPRTKRKPMPRVDKDFLLREILFLYPERIRCSAWRSVIKKELSSVLNREVSWLEVNVTIRYGLGFEIIGDLNGLIYLTEHGKQVRDRFLAEAQEAENND